MDKGYAMWKGKFLKDMTRNELYETFDEMGKMQKKDREESHEKEMSHMEDLYAISKWYNQMIRKS